MTHCFAKRNFCFMFCMMICFSKLRIVRWRVACERVCVRAYMLVLVLEKPLGAPA